MFSIDRYGKIRLTRGDTASIRVAIKTNDGKDYEIKPLDELKLTLKKNVNSEPLYTYMGQGDLILIPPNNNIGSGLYIYDIQLKTELGNIYTIAHAYFEVYGEVSTNG